MIVLDTHTLVWWVGHNERLSNSAEAVIKAAQEANALFVSSFTAWELALLDVHGKLTFLPDLNTWFSAVSQLPGIYFVPVDHGIAMASVNLPGHFHKDPADRIIVATARNLAAAVVTADQKIRAYPHVQSIW